ncbi:2-oxoglutarate and iron-dependent oxygenase JMJD4 isoform X1 [Athalia rosae]|uniref:2-oxoglutarate and iron-dependent oxygenase JMJD4 isoform X1 n=1 Tax=Athalia rosae TaxID=37344 RepID=UPI00203400D7|nr:2-oxoglutarate and iron-dependent oxygenase JMJD4 isoform X1 [Athalia rosae]
MTNVIEICGNDANCRVEFLNQGSVIEYVDSSLSYNEYFFRYLLGNTPCIIQNATDSWPSRQKWHTNNTLNFEYLKKIFGTTIVPVADCTKRSYNSQMKHNMSMNDYIDYWVAYRNSGHATNMPLLYLKDWHCVKNYPNIPIYQVPQYFGSDWLNEYYTEQEGLDDDYMFVYMGPKGTWTPFHVDVFSSYSWSANVVGTKRWILFKPGKEDSLRDKHGQLIYDVTSMDRHVGTRHAKRNENTVEQFEIIQRPGEIVFVPSGWHHQVWNLEDTISINHNWINAGNIWNVWTCLKKELLAVKSEIEDCRDMDSWDEHCQVMLKASHGINYVQFYKFLCFLAKKRIASIKEMSPMLSFGRWHLGRNHCLYDLKQIMLVLTDMINDVHEKGIHSLVFPKADASSLVDEIGQLLPESN